MNSPTACTDRIRCRAYHHSNVLLLEGTVIYCGYFFLPYRFPITQSLLTVVFWQLESRWQFLVKSLCIFGGCGDNWLWLRPQKLPILHCSILSTTFLRRLCCACFNHSYPKRWLHFETCYWRTRTSWPFHSCRRGSPTFLGLVNIHVLHFRVMVPSW